MPLRKKLSFLFCFISVFFIHCVSTQPQTEKEVARLRNEVKDLKDEIIDLRKRMEVIPERSFTLLCAGDILIAQGTRAMIREEGIQYPFLKLRDFTQRFDFVFANLEMPVTERGNPYSNKAYCFRIPPQVAETLATSKLSAVSLANNHIMDYGPTGLVDTMSFLEKKGIEYTGAGLTEERARKPVKFTFGSTEVYILAYCARHPESYFAEGARPGAAKLDLEIIKNDIIRYQRKNALVFVSLHWGVEQRHMPSDEQRKMAHAIIKAGADGIIGHHPHWPQAVEVYRNRPILYSLGNYINGYTNKIEKDNLFAAFHIERGRLIRVDLYSIAGRNRYIKYQPYVQTGKVMKRSLGLVSNLSRKFNTKMEFCRDHVQVILYP